MPALAMHASTMPDGVVHIFTAVHAEAKAIRRVLPAHCELHVIGIRAVHLPKNLPPCRGIIMAGFGGALDPSLSVGDVVIDDPPGRIYTSQTIISTPAEKAALFQQTRAQVVDMENAIVRKYAEQLSVPFIGIRAVSDTADESLDPAVLNFVDDRGRPRPGRIAVGLLKRPSLIPALRVLGKNAALAADRLAAEVVRIVACGFAGGVVPLPGILSRVPPEGGP